MDECEKVCGAKLTGFGDRLDVGGGGHEYVSTLLLLAVGNLRKEPILEGTGGVGSSIVSWTEGNILEKEV